MRVRVNVCLKDLFIYNEPNQGRNPKFQNFFFFLALEYIISFFWEDIVYIFGYICIGMYIIYDSWKINTYF